jgi:DNA-binding HxlR family transcriptional regulator
MSTNEPRERRRNRSRPLIALDDCGLALASNLLGDRWTLLILREAFYGVTRFDDMREDLSASRHALSSRLESLTASELLARRPYREPGERERDEYVLTDKGRSLAPVLLALLDWGQQCLLPPARRVALVEQSTGQAVKGVFVTSDGRTVDPRDVTLKLRTTRAGAAR